MTTLQTVRALYAAGLTKDAVDQIVQITTQADAGVTDAAAAQADATTGIADAATAQTSADNAGAFWVVTPASHVWNSDTSGTHEAGNPTQDVLFTLRDVTDSSALATATLRGTMTSATGNITVSLTGSDTGLTTTKAYDPTNNADPTVKATVTATHADGSKSVGVASWSSVDESTAGGTPSSGAGK